MKISKTPFTPSWKKSKQPRKQRMYRYNAPLHIKQKFMHVHLSPELRKKYLIRNTQLKKGDKIKVMRGQFKKKEGRVERISLKKEQVFITGIEKIKKEGTKLLVAFQPSNLMITELNMDDKKRKQKLESKLIEKKEEITKKPKTEEKVREDKK
jgi:large subunit ribosomal protein L24